MTWLDAPGFERRSLVFVEDHLYHTGELIAAIAAQRPDLANEITVCAIDRAGPDTDATVDDWLTRMPALQVAAPTPQRDRVWSLDANDLATLPAAATFIAGLLRPGGILVQDIQLSTLPFVPADRWWESIFVAATVRGLFAERPPIVRFLSNKRGYAATFGRDLLAAGFDPRDVIDKSELTSLGVSAMAGVFDRHFPLVLETPAMAHTRRRRVAEADRGDIERALDVVYWPSASGADIGGRLVAGREGRVSLRAGGHEAETWRALVENRLAGGDGVPVLSVGERVGPADAERAELTNVAARHVHTLRGRLTDGAAIITARHAYALADHVTVGIVKRAAS